MQKIKQTIIMGGNDNEMATITFEKKNNFTFGTLKLFCNLNKRDLVLAISNNNQQIFKQNIVLNGNNTYTFKFGGIDDFGNIGCVLVEFNNGKYVPIMWGKKNNCKDKVLNELNDVYTSNLNGNNVSIKANSVEKLFEENEEEIENVINDEFNKHFEKDAGLIYDEDVLENNLEKEIEDSFYSFKSEEEKVDIFEEENKKLGDFEKGHFFELIAEQIDDLFENYPRVDELEELIPNSKWVKIDFENDGNEYVLGLIYEGFDLKYICYGVPGKFNAEPPKQLGECQWLPLNPKDPSDGYFVIYQDALTGEKINII